IVRCSADVKLGFTERYSPRSFVSIARAHVFTTRRIAASSSSAGGAGAGAGCAGAGGRRSGSGRAGAGVAGSGKSATDGRAVSAAICPRALCVVSGCAGVGADGGGGAATVAAGGVVVDRDALGSATGRDGAADGLAASLEGRRDAAALKCSTSRADRSATAGEAGSIARATLKARLAPSA